MQGKGPLTQARKLPESRIEQLSFPERCDVRAIETLRPLLQRRETRLLGQLGQLGNEPPLLLFSAGLFVGGWWARRPILQRAAVRMALAHLFSIGFKEWGKNHVDRSRPDEQLKEGRYRMAWGHSRDPALRSFPSGHTAGALAVARAFSRDVPLHGKPALIAAGLIGALQVVRRAHYPGDVVVGAIGGAICERIATFLVDRIDVPPWSDHVRRVALARLGTEPIEAA